MRIHKNWNKIITIDDNNFTKWISINIPKDLYINLFTWMQTHDEFNEDWPLDINEVLSETSKNKFEINISWYTDKAKIIYIKPKGKISKRIIKSYIISVFKDLWISSKIDIKWRSSTNDGSLKWNSLENIEISFKKTIRNWFDVNIAE